MLTVQPAFGEGRTTPEARRVAGNPRNTLELLVYHLHDHAVGSFSDVYEFSILRTDFERLISDRFAHVLPEAKTGSTQIGLPLVTRG